MASNDRPQRELIEKLKTARKKHRVLLDQVLKTRSKLEKRSRKLDALEAKIAHFQQMVAEPQQGKLGQASGNGDKTLRRALLVFNPNSGEGDSAKQLADIVSLLRENRILADIALKTSGKAARQLAQEAVRNREGLVVVAGGDGTIEDVASELVNTRTIMGIVPIGSMNNLARALGIPLDIGEACKLVGVGLDRRIDVGRVHVNERPQIEYFLESAGIGLSAVVIPAGQAVEKSRWDALPDALRRLFDVKPVAIQIELDGGDPIEVNSQMVTISNSPMIGKNVMVAPDAKMDDGYLDVATYEGMNKTDLLQHFIAASNETAVRDPRVQFYRARRIRITSDEKLAANSDKDLIQLDDLSDNPDADSIMPNLKTDNGKAAGTHTRGKYQKYILKIEAIPQSLSVICGNGIGLSLPVAVVPSVGAKKTGS